MDTKKCSCCNIDKPLIEFRKIGNQCKTCLNHKHKIYYINNKEILLIKVKNRYNIKGHTKEFKEHKHNYDIKHCRLERVKLKRKEYIKNKSLNANFRIFDSLRSRIRISIKLNYGKKAYKTMQLLGCSIEDGRKWIEGQFKPGMTWDNYGHDGWHIDHIIPCDTFDLTDPKQQLECFHYTNLQPMWALENLQKGNKIEVFTSEGIFWV